MTPSARRRREESEMRTDLSMDGARSLLDELARRRLPPVTAPLFELRLTETGALRFPGGVAELSDEARQRLALLLETSAESIATDGDHEVAAVLNGRLARASDRVCLRRVRSATGILVRAIVEPLRPVVHENLLADVLALLDQARACGVEQGASVTLLSIRTGRRFEAGGWSHEHGLVVSLDEGGLAMAFGAVFLPRTEMPALRLARALRVDAPPFDVAASLRDAIESEASRAALVGEAMVELTPRPLLLSDIYLDHPAIPPEYVRRIRTRLIEREALTRYDVAVEMLAHVETLDARARLAVAWRAGDVLFIDD